MGTFFHGSPICNEFYDECAQNRYLGAGECDEVWETNDGDRTFLNKVFNFIGVGLALYSIASIYSWLSSDAIIKHTVKCKYCRKRISEKVSKSFLPSTHGRRWLVDLFLGRQNGVSTVRVGRMAGRKWIE